MAPAVGISGVLFASGVAVDKIIRVGSPTVALGAGGWVDVILSEISGVAVEDPLSAAALQPVRAYENSKSPDKIRNSLDLSIVISMIRNRPNRLLLFEVCN